MAAPATVAGCTTLCCGQPNAGAQAVQLFDSWAGLHDARTYREFAKPYNTRIFEALESYGAPRLYIAVDALHLCGQLTDLPCEVVSVDWRAPLSQVTSARR